MNLILVGHSSTRKNTLHQKFNGIYIDLHMSKIKSQKKNKSKMKTIIINLENLLPCGKDNLQKLFHFYHPIYIHRRRLCAFHF